MTFSCHIESQSSSVSSSKAVWTAMPTLFTRQSTRPKLCSASATSSHGAPGRERSAATCSASPTPGASSLRALVTTRAPSAASRRAASRPIPAVEPVTMQTRSRRPSSTRRLAYTAVTRIYLARHGESDWNAENRFQGHSDRPLTSRGREQAVALAGVLEGTRVDAIYTSPLRRALETAEIVAGRIAVGMSAIEALREVDVGGWAGLSRAEVGLRF